MTTDPSHWRRLLPPRSSAVDDRQAVLDVVTDLLEHQLETSPHVAAKLLRALNGDQPTIREVAAMLSPAQRKGHRALPLPLPLVTPIVAAFEHLRFDEADHALLLVAALSTDDHIDLLVEFGARTPADLTAGVMGELLGSGRGKFWFLDARLPVWLQETASRAQRASAHDQLFLWHSARGEGVRAAWHRARAAAHRTPEVVSQLVSVARRLSEAGHPEWGYRLAAEAAEHAEGEARDEARLVAGAAAISVGWVEDAAELLGSLFPAGALAHRAQAMASLLIAETHVRGNVPVLNPREYRPATDEQGLWHAWARTAGLAAALCAERGARTEMRSWLTEVRAADARARADGAIQGPAVALCWLLSGEEDGGGARASGPFSGGMIDALRAGLDGDFDDALRILASEEVSLSEETDPLVAGFEHSPMVAAYRAVVEVLVLFWRGDVTFARDRLLSAAVDLPVALPFAGLGVVLARRLDLAVLGQQGTLAQSLTAVLPSGIRIDRLVDRSIEAYLAGAVEAAASEIKLWSDRGAPAPALAVPGLDEVGLAEATATIGPPEQTQARALRRRIRRASETSWRREYPDLAELARELRSPFNRGRVEAMLGATCVMRGDRAAGRRHLRAARSLFSDAGADAWCTAVDVRLARLGEQLDADTRVATVPIPIVSAVDPMATCRVAWESLLTDRELEIAMLVVEGALNKEIASDLTVSVRTVEVHVSRILDKLDVRGRVELTALAHRTNQHL